MPRQARTSRLGREKLAGQEGQGWQSEHLGAGAAGHAQKTIGLGQAATGSRLEWGLTESRIMAPPDRRDCFLWRSSPLVGSSESARLNTREVQVFFNPARSESAFGRESAQPVRRRGPVAFDCVLLAFDWCLVATIEKQ